MSMTIGELVGYIRADGSNFDRSLAASQLRMEGFRVGVDGRLRDLAGRFVDESEVMGRALADGFTDAERAGTRIVRVYDSVADAQSRTLRARFQRIAQEGRRLGDRLGDAFGRARRAFERLDFARLRGAAGAIGNVAMAVGRMGATAGAAVPVVAGLAAAAGQLAPAAGVAVTGMIAMRLAAVALKLGMVGVEDAISSALDPEKAEEFEEAVKKLAPEAQKVARGIKAMAPALREVQQTVQNRLFMGLDQVLKGLAKDTLPVLRTGVMDAADSLNAMAKGVGHSAQSLARNGTLGTAIAGANAGLRNLSRAPGQFVTALTQIGAAAAPAFGRLTAAAGKALDSFSQKFTKAFQSGAMEKAIEQAIALFAQLGRIAGNVFGTLGNIFRGVSADGGGLFGVLETITQALEDATATEGFQEALRALSGVMGTIAKNIGPLLKEAFEILGPVIAKLGPPIEDLINQLGESFLQIMEELGPVLAELADAFAELMPALLPIVELAGELVAGLLPALTPLFEELGRIFREMTPFIRELVANLSEQLKPILESLAREVLPKLLPFFGELAERLFPLLMELLVELGPSLTELALAFGDLLVEVAPLVAEILKLTFVLMDMLMPILKPIVMGLAMLVSEGLQLVTAFLRRYAIPTLRFFIDMLSGDFAGAMGQAKQVMANMTYDGIVRFIRFREQAGQALRQLQQAAVQYISQMTARMYVGLQQGLARVMRRFVELPATIRAAMSGAGAMLYGIGQSIIRGLISGVRSMIPSLSGVLGGITASLPDWKGPANVDAKILTPAGRSVIEGFQRGIAAQVPALRSQLQGLTGGMPGMALAGAGGFRAGGGVPTVRVVVDGPEAVKSLIRTIVIEDGGGDVSRAFNTP